MLVAIMKVQQSALRAKPMACFIIQRGVRYFRLHYRDARTMEMRGALRLSALYSQNHHIPSACNDEVTIARDTDFVSQPVL